DHAIDPGAPQSGSSYEGTPSKFEPLPLTLKDALDAFASDAVIRGTFPDDMTSLYLELKNDEWARFCGHVTDWEREMYTDQLP
ncbi:glutamine synthetase, partial [Actinomadura adrarensis]